MLGKLIKQEFRETWKIPSIILSVALLLSAAFVLFFRSRPLSGPEVELNAGLFALFMIYTIFISCTGLFVLLYVGVRYYRNLFTDEGYLMHTLPVRPWKLLVSKLTVATLWSYLINLLLSLFLVPIMLEALPRLTYMPPEVFAETYQAMLFMFGRTPLQLFLVFGPYSLISAAFGCLTLYTGISLGQLFGRHKVLASILCYLGLSGLISAATSLFLVPAMTGMIITNADQAQQFMEVLLPSLMQTAYCITFFVSLILGTAAFFLINYLMNRCLNLD